MTTALALLPFVPSGPDFERALDFFSDLGFELQWRNGGLAGLRQGGAAFILQHIDIPEWQNNQMLTLDVDDLDGYWSEIVGKQLPERYAGARIKEPTQYPWGREVHIIDPAGVCWHIRQGAEPPRPDA